MLVTTLPDFGLGWDKNIDYRMIANQHTGA